MLKTGIAIRLSFVNGDRKHLGHGVGDTLSAPVDLWVKETCSGLLDPLDGVNTHSKMRAAELAVIVRQQSGAAAPLVRAFAHEDVRSPACSGFRGGRSVHIYVTTKAVGEQTERCSSFFERRWEGGRRNRRRQKMPGPFDKAMDIAGYRLVCREALHA